MLGDDKSERLISDVEADGKVLGKVNISVHPLEEDRDSLGDTNPIGPSNLMFHRSRRWALAHFGPITNAEEAASLKKERDAARLEHWATSNRGIM